MPSKAARPTPPKARAAGLRVLDFRSDTVTQPTAQMRAAMAEADVGDDVYGEDPSVNRLQTTAAKLLGMEAALFVPTGTMGNQIAVAVHSGRGGALVCEETCHISLYEAGASATLSGVSLKTVRSPDGTFTPKQVQHHVLPRDPHFSDVRLLAIENTHNFSGGRTWTAKQTQAIASWAHDLPLPKNGPGHRASQGLPGAALHIDGARLFNAAIAQRTTAANLARGADSVMVCLSKGLSAPVGSILAGSSAFIEQARFVRKTFGGGMRQAGHLAAAGLVALETCVERLADDHHNARRLAEGLADLPGLAVDLDTVETNMVMADVSATGMGSAEFLAAARKLGVLGNTRDAGPTVRFVTHRNLTRDDCDEAVQRLGKMLG